MFNRYVCNLCVYHYCLYFALFIIVRARFLLLSYAMDIHAYRGQKQAMRLSPWRYIGEQSDGGKTGGLIRFHGVLPLGKVDVLLVLPRRLQLFLVLNWQGRQGVLQTKAATGTYSGQPPPDSPRLLWSQIERKVLLFLVELPKVLTRLLVGHG